MSGKLVIVSAPSGAGKTTIVHHLLEQNLDLEFSVSATSREKRKEENHGQDYYFFSVEEFKKRVANSEFVEWEEVYPDQFYGTLKEEVERIWKKGKTVIFDVDVIGGLNLKKLYGSAALAIFIQAPSIQALEDRLRYRSTETEEKIQLRISKAAKELAKAPEFDTIVVNKDLEVAKKEAYQMVHNFLNK